MSAKFIARSIALACFVMATPVLAQNGQSPAEMPPADFEGREYVDSRGCVFLRSTFGGQVTWVPRFGPDRQPICNGQTTLAAPQAPAVAPPVLEAATPAPAPVAPAPTPEPAQPSRVTTAPVVAPVASAAPRQVEPVRRSAARSAAPRKATPARSTAPRGPNADGRHPDCPANAQFGRLVRMETGRIMVMCVMSPEHFPLLGTTAATKPVVQPAPKAVSVVHMPSQGRLLQAGSFRVPENATRLAARLQAQGHQVHLHRQGGLTVVTVGPFADSARAHQAMAELRHVGIRDAFFR